MALEVAQRYHHSEHRGLSGATPASAWNTLSQFTPPRQLPPGADEALNLLIQFMPCAPRSIQADGLTLFYIRYWHPIFAAWRERRRRVLVRYHPEDLSRVYATVDGKHYVEARYADLRRPAISLWEQRTAVRLLRGQGHRQVSEMLVFKAIEEQRKIVVRARAQTQRTRRETRHLNKKPVPQPWLPPADTGPTGAVDYSKSVEPFPIEIW